MLRTRDYRLLGVVIILGSQEVPGRRVPGHENVPGPGVPGRVRVPGRFGDPGGNDRREPRASD